MTKLLSVKNLGISFAGKTVVNNISFDLNKNEILGIVGESGSGKSVSALSVLGLVNNAEYTPASSVKLNGAELMKANEKDLMNVRGAKVGFIFQEPMSSLNPLHRIGAQVAETILIHQKVGKEEAKKQTLELLEKVGLKNASQRYLAYPYELSGGERQRVMIAMAIANKPDILIADEPTTALDVTIQKQIIDLILQLKSELGMSVIFISHDLKLVSRIADRILVMYQGKIVEQGKTSDVFNTPANKYTKTLIASSNLMKNKEKAKKKKVLELKNLKVQYTLKKNFLGKKIAVLNALDDVSLSVFEGQTLGVVGESGSGKTTLGQCVVNLIKYQGSIIFKPDFKGKDFSKNVQIIFQDPYNSLNPRMNVLEIVGEGLRVHNKNIKNNEIEEKVIDILESVGLEKEDLYKYPHAFSGGQRQRIAIARAMILNPKIVVLDEPTSALDVTIQKQIITLLKDFQKKRHMTYIFISHDMRAVKAMADDIAVMKNGKLVEMGSAEEILNNPKQDYTKTLISASVF